MIRRRYLINRVNWVTVFSNINLSNKDYCNDKLTYITQMLLNVAHILDF